MHTSDHAKFGNGIVKEGEEEDVRVWLDLINEAGGRSVMPFDGMLPADAYLWARYRDDPELLRRLGEMTQNTFDARRGFYGMVGDACVIKNCRIIKDVMVGPCAYIKGANKLKNLTINSSAEEPSQIGEGVELVNGIVGRGCHIFYGCKAVRFIMGDNSNLKYGARLIHSYLGDNSTVSCCEMLSNLIFPAHEQHHNNSFLIASLVMGQSNLAAAATIGSNHNSRAPDGEIHAGRGFWPGLCVSVKHNCRFASFVLLAKGDYPAEMDIPLPFSLVSNSYDNNRLQILPAYWWMYNMYALARNTWKFGARDKRRRKLQKIEFDSLAPDTAEEIFHARGLLELWVGKCAVRSDGKSPEEMSAEDLRARGKAMLEDPECDVDAMEILAEDVENSRRQVVVIKVGSAYRAYEQMLLYYAGKDLLAYMGDDPRRDFRSMCDELGGARETEWVNLGGQLAMRGDVDKLKAAIRSGELATWHDVHAEYDKLWDEYPMARHRHAFATLADLMGGGELTSEAWVSAIDEWIAIEDLVAEQTYATRRKDFESPFRQMSYETTEEMSSVLGTAEENSFVHQMRDEAQAYHQAADQVKARG
jgi:Domain of unknown function (DUF4954)/Domain of unknown function (DUF6819)